MAYTVEYFNQRVLDEIESWPVGVLGAYARLVELLMEFSPVLYCFVEGRRVMVLHAFIKKTQVAPQADLKIARRRMREVRSG
jgi:hypothetical protein